MNLKFIHLINFEKKMEDNALYDQHNAFIKK